MVETVGQSPITEEKKLEIKGIFQRKINEVARRAQNPIIAVRRNVFSDPQTIETLFEISGDDPAIVINNRGEIASIDRQACKLLAEEVVRKFGFDPDSKNLILSEEITTIKFARTVGFFKSKTILGLSLIETTVIPVTGSDHPAYFSWSVSNKLPKRLIPTVKI